MLQRNDLPLDPGPGKVLYWIREAAIEIFMIIRIYIYILVMNGMLVMTYIKNKIQQQ